MKGTLITTGIWSAFVLLVAAGCLGDAPRGNPLDPQSDAFRDVGALSGRITRFYPPHAGLPDAEVRLTPEQTATAAGQYVTRSGSAGQFLFGDVPTGRYRLVAEKDGFAPVVDTVFVYLGQRVEKDVRLDGLPGVAALSLRTVHISRWWPTDDLYLLEVAADVEDPDGLADVAAVWLAVPDVPYLDTLQASPVAGRYVETIPASTLPGGSLHALMGRPIFVYVRDHPGQVNVSAGQTLVRIIEQTPVAVAPQGLETVTDPRPVFTWERAALPFAFTYRVDVVRVLEANIQTVIFSESGLPPETTSWQVPSALSPGTYFWTISVVDAFGNRSRSKEAGFQVE